MTIAVTGHKGRLGSWLVEQGCIPLDCDVTKPQAIRDAIEETKPDVLINCAAFTDVDAAESKELEIVNKIMGVNFWGPANLRRNFDGLLIHISTSFIFSGENGPYRETDDITYSPANWYGMSKLGGEAAAVIREPTLIVRTSDLFGFGPKIDFVRSVRDQLFPGTPVEFSNILYGTPTYIPHLAKALLEVANRGLTGILHIAGDAILTRYEWAKEIAKAFDMDPDLCVPVKRAWGDAPRPLRAGLLVGKAKEMGIPIYSPLDGLSHLRAWEDHHEGEAPSPSLDPSPNI